MGPLVESRNDFVGAEQDFVWDGDPGYAMFKLAYSPSKIPNVVSVSCGEILSGRADLLGQLTSESCVVAP